MKTLHQHIVEKLKINSTYKRINFDFNEYLNATHVLILSFEHPEDNECEIQYELLKLSNKIIKDKDIAYKNKYIVNGNAIGFHRNYWSCHFSRSAINDILYLINSSRLIIAIPLSHITNYNYDIIKNLEEYDNHNLSFNEINDMFFIDITYILTRYVKSNKIFIYNNKNRINDLFNKIRGMRK